MYIKTSCFVIVYEVKKDLQDFSAEIGILKNQAHNIFSCNLTSKSARSTLTSPSTSKAKCFFKLYKSVHIDEYV